MHESDRRKSDPKVVFVSENECSAGDHDNVHILQSVSYIRPYPHLASKMMQGC